MKAISSWQPWAMLIALGLKKNETRSWYTNYRGPLLIHAAKRKPKKKELHMMWGHLVYFDIDPLGILEDLPLGAILCQVDLIDCQKVTSENFPSEHSLELYLGDYTHGRYMWITDNLKKFKEPIPYKGSQGVFNVPEEVINGCL